MRSICRQLSRDNRGVGALEYALVLVPLLYGLITIVEVAGMMVTQQALDQVTSQAAEQVSTGAILSQSPSAAATTIKSFICGKNLALISTANCSSNLQIAVRDITATVTAPSSINANGTLNTAAFGVQAVPDANIVMVRAAVAMPQMSPFWNPVLNNMGEKRLLVSTAVTRLHRYARYNVEGSQ